MKYLKIFEDFQSTSLETPPKWFKNPAIWAMDKIVQLFTPETNIHRLSIGYFDSGLFKFEDVKILESSIKNIYLASKSGRELDAKDAVRTFQSGLVRKFDKVAIDNFKSKSAEVSDLMMKFENLIKYLQ